MDYSVKFQEVLNTNEKIIKIYKPNIVKYWVAKILYLIFIAGCFACIITSFSLMTNEFDEVVFNMTSLAISTSILACVWLLLTIYLIFFYRNLYYCVTTQRVIVRQGVFGTDFKTLDMQMIGATNVHVSLLDKIVHKNTGSIIFGSNSAPIVGKGSTFIFKDIVNPYEESKEIKTAVDNFRTKEDTKTDKTKKRTVKKPETKQDDKKTPAKKTKKESK